MIGVTYNFGQLPKDMRARSTTIDAAVQAGLRVTLDKGEAGMTRNLSGGGKPGSYPVPRRSGNLARSVGSRLGNRAGVLFDSALYAAAIHNGFRPFGNANAPFYPGRPFLDDTVNTLDPAQDITVAWERLQ